ncbi:MAG TPA: hypothetical protein VK083_10040 [Nocardia sp.]|uniref:hypothetical protein n=1 Tax=Nocardia TaxID=1817 RepID=UPI002453C3DB|nr:MULTISPECIES: hypothetical protein [Nocardia]HLS77118.1 hypothetical protein [Nocardia sp.]
MRARTAMIAGALAGTATLLGHGIAAAEPATVIAEDGLYLVGTDIAPGTYEAPGTSDPARACEWARLWKVVGDTTDPTYILANNFTRKPPGRVVVKPTDAAFRTENCGVWRLVPDAASTGSAG